jgi:hypothetical protein
MSHLKVSNALKCLKHGNVSHVSSSIVLLRIFNYKHKNMCQKYSSCCTGLSLCRQWLFMSRSVKGHRGVPELGTTSLSVKGHRCVPELGTTSRSAKGHRRVPELGTTPSPCSGIRVCTSEDMKGATSDNRTADTFCDKEVRIL